MNNEFKIRPFESRDLSGVSDVLTVLRSAMIADSITEARFTRQVLLDPNFRAEGAPVAVADDGEIIGFCLSIARQVPLENAPSDAERGYITLLAVRPDVQRQGIGERLLAYAEAYLKSQNRSVVMVSPYAPGYFIPGVDVAAYAGALQFFVKHGYAQVYRPLAMETALWSLKCPEWVRERVKAPNVKVVPFEFQLTLPLLEFVQREVPGDWVRVVRETAGRIMTGDSPDRLLIAMDDGAIVGFSHFENERFGPVGVAASQRGRGVGQLLMFATLGAQREAGFRVAWFLWSDDKTAQRLYNVAGFKEVRRFALMKKELRT
jgi:GNAT superfamily N-acetyltransferase